MECCVKVCNGDFLKCRPGAGKPGGAIHLRKLDRDRLYEGVQFGETPAEDDDGQDQKEGGHA